MSVEAHLVKCSECRRELEQLESLSAILQQAPVPPQPEGERFSTKVKLRIPPASMMRPRSNIRLVWQAAPVVVVCGWALTQAVLFTGGLSLTLGLDRYLQAALPGLDWNSGPAAGGLVGENILGLDPALLNQIEPVVGLIALELIVSIVTACLLGGWLASWWSLRRSRLPAAARQ
jgi:hypothetical protein